MYRYAEQISIWKALLALPLRRDVNYIHYYARTLHSSACLMAITLKSTGETLSWHEEQFKLLSLAYASSALSHISLRVKRQ